RQQTMEHTIAWSYDLLTKEQQRAFRMLSVFEGGWTLEAAEMLGNKIVDGTALPFALILAALVDASLVQIERSAVGVTRFRYLDTVRAFARERLKDVRELGYWRECHAIFFAGAANEAREAFEQGRIVPSMMLAITLPNVRAAQRWVEEHHAAGIGLQLAK